MDLCNSLCTRPCGSAQRCATVYKAKQSVQVQHSTASCNGTKGKRSLHYTYSWAAYQHLTLQLHSYCLTRSHPAADLVTAPVSRDAFVGCQWNLPSICDVSYLNRAWLYNSITDGLYLLACIACMQLIFYSTKHLL